MGQNGKQGVGHYGLCIGEPRGEFGVLEPLVEYSKNTNNQPI
jgi:hypothetical protein